jgi:hypothetical protein
MHLLSSLYRFTPDTLACAPSLEVFHQPMDGHSSQQSYEQKGIRVHAFIFMKNLPAILGFPAGISGKPIITSEVIARNCRTVIMLQDSGSWLWFSGSPK